MLSLCGDVSAFGGDVQGICCQVSAMLEGPGVMSLRGDVRRTCCHVSAWRCQRDLVSCLCGV